MINAISKLNEKLKIIILIFYTALAVLVAFLLVSCQDKIDYFKEYGTNPSNDEISVTLKIKENRESTYKTKTDYETSTFFINAYAQKGAKYKKAKYSNIRYSLVGENKNGKISFDETSSTYQMSYSNTTGVSTSSTISSASVFKRKITVENEVVTDTDNLAVILGLKVLYTIEYNETITNEDGSVEYKYNQTSNKEVTTINSEFNYKIELTQLEDVETKFSTFDSRKLNGSIVENEKDPIDLKIEADFTDSETKEGSVKSDKLTFTPTLNNPNIAGKEIENYRIEAFGKVLNDKKDTENMFADYIRVYTVFGKDLSASSVKLAGVEIDEKYDVSEIYVIGYVKCVDGTEYNFNYKVNLK